MRRPRIALSLRRRRTSVVAGVVLVMLCLQWYTHFRSLPPVSTPSTGNVESTEVLSDTAQQLQTAEQTLDELEVKGRAPKTGYTRSQFGDGWARIGNCDVRNLILQRDLQAAVVAEDGCIVLSGTLSDPYTAKTISFARGEWTSDDVQIDHVVALSDAWQKGAQLLDFAARQRLANDALNLLAVDGGINQKKGDSDAASWLPPNKDYRCRYVARQIAVKKKHKLWVTEAEKSAIKRVLAGCRTQQLPSESLITGVESRVGN